MPPFDPRHASRLLAFFTSLFMSFLMSGVVTAINVGLPGNFVALWLHAFVMAFAISFPTILLVLPVAKRLVEKLTGT